VRHWGEDKEGDEQANAAIGDEGAGEHDRQHGAPWTETIGHEIGDGRYRAAVLHQLAEQGAEEKNREELDDEASGAPHEGLRPMGEQRFSGQSGGENRRSRSEQKNAPTPVGEKDQEAETDENAEKSHASNSLQENVDIERRAAPDVLRMPLQKDLRGLSPLIAQV
jgi:hypothetical protein